MPRTSPVIGEREAEILTHKQTVRAATLGALPAYTVSADFTVLTAVANGAFPAQDGVALALPVPGNLNRLLVKDEPGGLAQNNGIFELAQVGDAGSPWVLTRTYDANGDLELRAQMTISVAEGTQRGSVWYINTADPITLGVTPLSILLAVPPGGAAPNDAQYVVMAVNATLPNERVLTGTANRVTFTDGGAGNPVTATTPQDTHTAATPQFAAMGLGVAAPAAGLIVQFPDNTGDVVVWQDAAGLRYLDLSTVNGLERMNLGNVTTNPVVGVLGTLEVSLEDANNAVAVTVATLGHTTTAAPGAGIGTRLLLQAEADAGVEDAGFIQAVLTNVGVGTEASEIEFATRDAGGVLLTRWTMEENGGLTQAAGGGAVIITGVLNIDNSLISTNTQNTDLEIRDNAALSFEVGPSGLAMMQFDTRNTAERVVVNSHLTMGVGGGVDVRTLSGDLVIGMGDAHWQQIDPNNAAGRNVDLPPEQAGLWYYIANFADAAENLVVREDTGVATIVTLNQNEAAFVVCDGVAWQLLGVFTISQT